MIMSIFQKKTSDIPSIFSHMFTKLPLITEKKITVVKNLCTKNFQTCKKDVMFVLIFKKLQKTFQFF